MKANEAPKKIQLGFVENENHSLKIRGISYLEETQDGLIEYIRTDAFIEKACDFFEENIEEEDCKFGSAEWVELRSHYESLDSFIRAFRNYMKGE